MESMWTCEESETPEWRSDKTTEQLDPSGSEQTTMAIHREHLCSAVDIKGLNDDQHTKLDTLLNSFSRDIFEFLHAKAQ